MQDGAFCPLPFCTSPVTQTRPVINPLLTHCTPPYDVRTHPPCPSAVLPPHPRCSSVGADDSVRPTPRSGVIPSQCSHWRGNPFSFSCLRRPLFFQQRKKRGKETPPKLRFWISLRAFTRHLSCLSLPRGRCAVQTSPKSCIVTASLSAAAFALKYRRTSFYRGRDQRQRRRRRDDPFDRTTK